MIKIKNKKISKLSKPFFIADIAANHDGSLSRAKKLIKLAAEAGADAAKFQHFQAHTIVSDLGFKKLGKQKSHQANWKKSVFDTYKDASLDLSWTEELKNECEKNNIIFFTSPYSLELVEYINKFVPAFKIGSGDITWLEIIELIAKKKKPVLLATGASSLSDVKIAVDTIKKFNRKIILMQCNTNYTASLNNFKYLNLNVLKTYQKLYPEIILGLSDHTPGYASVIAAISLGAVVIEKHFTDDNSRIGPDHKFSMTPKVWEEMVIESNRAKLSFGDGVKRIEKNEEVTSILQRRSIRFKKNILKSEKINLENIEFLRPCPKDAYPANRVNKIIGKRLKITKYKGDYLKYSDI